MKLKCSGLQVGYRQALLSEPLDWRIEPGQRWSILGSNGCGKSTLLRTLAGLIPPLSGELSLNDKRIHHYRKRQLATAIGFLPQASDYQFPMTVEEAVLMGRYPWQSGFARESANDKERAAQAIEQMDLAKRQQTSVTQLSGGEMRRVAMAMLLCQSPRIVLLDEPESHLDPGVKQRLLSQFFTHQHHHDKSLIMVLHDPTLALRVSTHLLLIDRHGNVMQGTVEAMATVENLSKTYNHPMQIMHHDQHAIVVPE